MSEGLALKFRLAVASVAVNLCLVACDRHGPVMESAAPDVRPLRIVSLDYCADQYVLKLADPDQILAISPDATKGFSYMREAAIGVPTVRPIAEDVLILKPDLVVRSYGGGPNAATFFERAGVPVLQVGFASDIDGEGLRSITRVIQDMADGLGQAERGSRLIEEFRRRMNMLDKRTDSKTVLYMTPGGVTSGPGSLVHEMISAAGLENFESQAGWRDLPLEQLVYEQPDLVAAAVFDSRSSPINGWSPTNHPVAKAQLTGTNLVPLEGAWTACGGWFILDAIEALAEEAAQ